MRCAQLIAELCAYLDQEGPTAQADLEAHLAACRKCRLLVQTCRQTILLYREELPPELPAAIHNRVMANLRQSRP
ncbi:MAG: anti-sigma factor family protein [Terriglobales bacterium]